MDEQGVNLASNPVLTIAEVALGLLLVLFIVLSLTIWRRFELFLSVRYLRAKRRSRAISIVSVISVLGVALGVAVLSVVLAVMNGFEHDLQDKILGTNAHIIILNQMHAPITNADKMLADVEAQPHVTNAAPFVFSEGLASSPYDTVGVAIRGIDPERENRITHISERMTDGEFSFARQLSPANEGELPEPVEGVVLGLELAKSLQVEAGDQIIITSPGLAGEQARDSSMWSRVFYVSGVFTSGMYEYDSKLVYMSLPSAQNFLGLKDNISGLEVWVDDIYSADKVARSLTDILGYPFFARDWMSMNYTFFSALRLEKTVMFIILVLIVLVAAFSIASTLIMIVIEKRKEIGILKSMGANRASIMRIFMGQGLIIGLFGTGIGIVLGYLGSELLRRYKFVELPMDVYLIDKLPVLWSWNDTILIGLASMGIVLAATLGPAFMASRLEPVEAIRYE